MARDFPCRGAAVGLSLRPEVDRCHLGPRWSPEHQQARSKQAGLAHRVPAFAIAQLVLDPDQGAASVDGLDLELTAQELRDEVNRLGRPRPVIGLAFGVEVLVSVLRVHDPTLDADVSDDGPIGVTDVRQLHLERTVAIDRHRNARRIEVLGPDHAEHFAQLAVERPSGQLPGSQADQVPRSAATLSILVRAPPE
jgi:hypothetical protein